MGTKRKKIQMKLAFMMEDRGETPNLINRGTEAPVAESVTESPAVQEHLMEEVLQRENLKKAYQRVKSNKGSPGVDGITVERLWEHLKDHWAGMKEQLRKGTYGPQPVKRVEIPKPSGGTRKLGIPTVVDRFIQQALTQALQGKWDRGFSSKSLGFRPGRSAHQAVKKAREYIGEGYTRVVDTDMEKFFDRVNHDKVMRHVAKRVSDKRAMKLIRSFLNAGIMENGLMGPTVEGTPQGGPLSPLLSNLVLNEPDSELERRGHRFVRYADDSNIYVRSERAGKRVMESVSRFISNRLKLKVNSQKSAVARPWERSFLGFSFMRGEGHKIRIAKESLSRFKCRVKEITRRSRGISLTHMIGRLKIYLNGWMGYFRHCETPTVLSEIDSWIRRRLRCFLWKQWRTVTRRYVELRNHGAGGTIGCADGQDFPWPVAG